MSAEMDDTYQAGYLRGYQKAFKVKLYRNNDTFFPPKEITIQQKHMNFDKFLTLCTDSVKPVFGAVRNIYTPMGRHRITKVDELKDGEAYVVAGNEKFRRHPYNEISTSRPRPIKPKQFDFSNGAIWDREGYAYVQPVVHNDQLRLISGRARKENENKHAIRIRAYANGDDLTSGCTVCIDRKLQDMDMIKDVLAMKLTIRAERIFRLDGTEILDPGDFEPDMRVVCVPRYEEYRGEKFNRFYGEIRPNLTTSPRPTFPAKYSVLPPIRGGGESRSTKNEGSPEHSVNSTNRNKRGMAPNSNHATRPKQKRTPEAGKHADYDKDEGGVYKAKNPRNETVGAKQVKETHETKTDLPIDRRKAEVVKDERIKGENSKGYNNDNFKPKKTDHSNNKQDHSNNKQDHSNNKQASHKFNDDWDEPIAKNSQFRSSTPTPRKEETSKTNNKGNQKREEAATKIQAHFKGYKARQEYQVIKSQQKQKQQQQPKQKQLDDQRKQSQKNKKPSMDENVAATRIQAGFRGYKTRKELNEKKQVRDDKSKREREETGREENIAATRIQAGYRGYKTRKEIKAKKASLTKRDTKVDRKKKMSEDEAATKIQAGYRGYRVRQNLKNSKSSTQARPPFTKSKQGMDEQEAATRVQAGFRGYKTRKDMKTKKGDQEPSPNRQGKKYGEREERAAVQIQAGYRGYKARKEYKNSKGRK